jgi:hypothetical protein
LTARYAPAAATGRGSITSRAAAASPPFPGAVFGAAYATGTRPPALIAAGPGGLALSRDDGRSWETLDSLRYWSVGFGANGAGWAVGPGGRILRIATLLR